MRIRAVAMFAALAVASVPSATTATAAPSVEASWRVPGETPGVAVDAAGRAYAVTTVSNGTRGHALVRAYRADGSMRWERAWRPGGSSVVAEAITVADDGTVIVVGAVKYVEEPHACSEIWGWGWAIRAWSADGTVRWQRLQPGWDRCEVFGTHGRAVAARVGTVAMAVTQSDEYSSHAYVIAFDAHGERRWRRWIDPPGSVHESAADVAVGGDGSVYVAGTRNQGAMDEPERDQDAILVKLSSDGALRWIRDAPDLSDLGREDGDRGTSVAIGSDGVLFASVLNERDGRSRARLARYDADGTLRWQRAVPWVSGWRFSDAFTGARSDGAVLATFERNPDGGTHIVLRGYDPAGHLRWRQRVGRVEERFWGPTAMDARGDAIVVSGRPARVYGWNRVWLLSG